MILVTRVWGLLVQCFAVFDAFRVRAVSVAGSSGVGCGRRTPIRRSVMRPVKAIAAAAAADKLHRYTRSSAAAAAGEVPGEGAQRRRAL